MLPTNLVQTFQPSKYYILFICLFILLLTLLSPVSCLLSPVCLLRPSVNCWIFGVNPGCLALNSSTVLLQILVVLSHKRPHFTLHTTHCAPVPGPGLDVVEVSRQVVASGPAPKQYSTPSTSPSLLIFMFYTICKNMNCFF